MIETALDYLTRYGPIVTFAVLSLSGMGVPVPVTLTLLVGGALARSGAHPAVLLFAAALAGAVAGDCASYEMGKRRLRRMVDRLKHGRSWRRAKRKFCDHSDAAMLLTRFLSTPLAMPTNLIAGAEKYPFARFVGLCAVGEALHAGLFGTASHALGRN